MQIRRILFSTDFSEGSSHALPYAADIARQYGAKLFLMHVIYDVVKSAAWYVPQVSFDEIYRDMETSARAELEKNLIENMKDIKDVEYIVARGIPYEEIVKFAGDNKIDLIVLGTHGRRGIDRMLFGSTAEQVVRNAPCPVLSVRMPGHN